MPVRKTETRIPTGMQPADLGQAVVAADSRCALISYVPNPIVVARENTYVVLVSDPGLAAATLSFEWTFIENGGAPNVQTSDFGEKTYTPTATGTLAISVRLLGAAAAVQAELSMQQAIVISSVPLETLIDEAVSSTGPTAGSPDVLRELINEHNLYYQNVATQAAEA